MKLSIRGRFGILSAALLAVAMAACTQTGSPTTKPALDGRPTIRVKAGSDVAIKDAKGVTWDADKGYEGGTALDRPDLTVTGTDIPQIYHSERYGMDAYSFAVPNGKYKLNLYFSEDFDGNSSPDSRLFDYTVKDGDATSGRVIKTVTDFSPWKVSGAQFKACPVSYDVDVTKGRITITFVTKADNSQINAIEIIPQ